MVKRAILWLLVMGVALLALVAAYIGITVWRAGGEPPEWDGAVEVAGLESPVEVLRDEHGIPHIQASKERDLYFAQGFVHAQDRLWQMALMRQNFSGRLSEWLGRLGVPSDRRNRVLEVGRAATRSWSEFPESERRLLEAYVDGVNAWLDSRAFRRPPEMVLLHVSPERWRPEDVFLVFHQFQILATFGNELISALIGENSPSPEAVDIFDTDDRTVPPIVESVARATVGQPTAPFKDRAFSNNWTLSGDHTATGLPLMANDPQLPATLPGTWQLQVHWLGDRQVVGASIPGVPGIAVGHNGSVAWGVTNAVIDVNDASLLERHPDGSGRYRRAPDAAWERFSSRTETISVRFGSDVREVVRSTPTGVILPAELLPARLTDREDLLIELRYQWWDLPNGSPAAVLRLNRAATVHEGLQALDAFTGPCLNFSLADTAGNIAYVTAGKIPVRPEMHARQVLPGPQDDNMRRYLPYAENPRIVNPPSGRIVSANQRIIGDEYPYYLTDFWAPAGRALRIHELLDKLQIHHVESFREMQMDSLSPVARRLLPRMLTVEPASDADAALVRILEGWDNRFTLEAAAPTIFLTWVEMLNRPVIDDELGSTLSLLRATLYTPLEKALEGEHPEWCDDRSSEPVETCAQLLTETLTDAREALERSYGADPGKWQWARAGKLRLPHLGFGGLPILDDLFSRATPVPGGPESMFTNLVDLRTAPAFSTSIYLSSYQAIFDLSDLGASEFMTVGGASGHYKSPYYNNLTENWAKGMRIRFPAGPERLKPTATLKLAPKSDSAAPPG